MPKPRLLRRRHDRSHRTLFTHPRTVKDLLEGFVLEPWIEELDFSTLTKMPADYVSGQLAGEYEERAGDVVWRIEWKGKNLYVIVLLEFQSSCEEDMALRILAYLALFYQRLLKARPLRHGEKLPPVLPIVLYNGNATWDAPLDVAELVERVPESFRPFRPSLRYCLIDEKRWPLDRLQGVENVTARIFELARRPTPTELSLIIEACREALKEESALRRDLTAYLSKVVLPDLMPGIDLPELSDLDEFKHVEAKVQTWNELYYDKGKTEGYDEGKTEGYDEGKTEGLVEGEAKVVLRQLERKFGPLDEAVLSRIRSATADQLLEWADRVLRADRLDEVFA